MKINSRYPKLVNIQKSIWVFQSQTKEENQMIFWCRKKNVKIYDPLMIKILRKLGVEGIFLNLVKYIYKTLTIATYLRC